MEEKSQDETIHVFIDGDIKLSSAVSFAQYVIPIGDKLRLVTIIGEQHEREFDCGDHTTQTIANYAINTLENNPTSQVLLEIDPHFIDDPKKWPKSIPIREILTVATKNQDLLLRVGGYDWRNSWIGPNPREDLYHHDKKLRALSTSQMLDMYVKPFYEHEKDLTVDKKNYGPNELTYLSQNSPADLRNNMVHISDLIKTRWELPYRELKPDIITKLRHFWKKVTDWNIMRWVIINSPTTEIIAIMGEEHAKNLRDIFEGGGNKPVTQQSGKSNQCVSLYRSLQIKN